MIITNIKRFLVSFSKKKIILLFLLFTLTLLLAFYFQQNKIQEEMALKVQFIEQKNMLRDELDDLIDDHDSLLEEYGDLNNELVDKDVIIQNQISEIRSLIRTKNDLEKAKAKIKILKDISKRYLANIDSLYIVNEELIILKDSVIKVNKNINWKNYKLNKKNEELSDKVNRGSVLEISNLNVKTKRYRGTGSEVSTRYAKKVQKVIICFTVSANKISNAETKIVFMQLIDDENNVKRGNDEIQALIVDSTIDITTSSNFEYKNAEIEHCFEWERVDPLTKGNYLVKLIIEGKVLAQTSLKLR